MLLFTVSWARRCARVEAEFQEWSSPAADARPPVDQTLPAAPVRS